ncbi:MAG: ribonuclease E/G, partial [Betaproteobacteria bacterium]
EQFAASQAPQAPASVDETAPVATLEPVASRQEWQEAAAVPATPAPEAAPEPVQAQAAAVLPPAAASFVLPLEKLADVAQHAGLVWVNSDADKIAAVQAAIAATPAPIHVPRERPAPVVVVAAPLVLVETRRQLGQDA